MPETQVNVQRAIEEHIDAIQDRLWSLALDIHAHPELAFKEFHAARVLTDTLEAGGFAIERELGGLPTAFRASIPVGTNPAAGPTIALLAEYDALPGLGHACGHNLISSAAIGAALALSHAFPGADANGRIQVIGCPAEEGGGGKILLLQAGAFEGVDAAMMFHGGARTMTRRGSLALNRVTMAFHGKAAHAASWPHQGINALDACIQTFNAVNALRQHVRDETRIHGVITHGGAAPNIVPDYAEAQFLVRHPESAYAREVMDRVMNAARHAAESVGATVELTEGFSYEPRLTNVPLADRFGAYLEADGEPVLAPPVSGGVGSSDFNNLSQVLPAIHPYIKIAPEGTSAHTPEFAVAAASPAGRRAMILAARALARCAADLITDPAFLGEVKSAFQSARTPPASPETTSPQVSTGGKK